MTGKSRPEDGRTERDPARVVAFSDGVIAIAVTLLVLGLRPPQDTRHLLHGLAALWPSYVSYVITFMLVAHVPVSGELGRAQPRTVPPRPKEPS